MKRILILACIVLSLHYSLSAQTKKIAYRSHSGSNMVSYLSNAGNFGVVRRYTPEELRHMDSMWRVGFRKDSIRKARIADSIKKANTAPKIPITRKKKQSYNPHA